MNLQSQKWLLLAGACLVSGVMLGMVGYLVIPDQNLKLVLMTVACLDLVAATFFMAKAFRAK